MNKIKWFSGGKERSNSAVEIIAELLKTLDNNPTTQSLKDTLLEYQNELQNNSFSVPLVLSRMTIEISKVIKENSISLSEKQSDLIKELNALLSIRYGY